MDVRRAIGMAAAAAALITAQPAFAQGTIWSSGLAAHDANGNELTETGTGVLLTSDASTFTVALACTARAPKAVATSVTECYLEGANGARYDVSDRQAMPGPADAEAGRVDVPRQPYKVCVASIALFGLDVFAAPLSCSRQA